MAKGSDWYAACPHCKGSGNSDEPKEPKVHYRGDGSITPNPKYTENPDKKKNNRLPGALYAGKKDKGPSSNKDYPDYKRKNPPSGGSSVLRKPKPKSPAGGAAKNR